MTIVLLLLLIRVQWGLPSAAFPLSLTKQRHTRLQATIDTAIIELMREHDPILLFASQLLEPSTAADAAALYAWCRRLDELVDNTLEAKDRQVQLEAWKDRFESLWQGDPIDSMDAALTETLQRRCLTRQPFEDMMAGMQADAVDDRRVETQSELEVYAYQVAGTVGLMLLPLLNAAQEEAKEPAIQLGQAIQLINILRDARADAALGRIYLPQEWLQEYGVLEKDVLTCQASPEYCRVVERVARRASELLVQAERGRTTLPGLGPLFVQVIVELYRRYLVELEDRSFDNLSPNRGDRVKISTWSKVGALLTAAGKVLVPS